MAALTGDHKTIRISGVQKPVTFTLHLMKRETKLNLFLSEGCLSTLWAGCLVWLCHWLIRCLVYVRHFRYHCHCHFVITDHSLYHRQKCLQWVISIAIDHFSAVTWILIFISNWSTGTVTSFWSSWCCSFSFLILLPWLPRLWNIKTKRSSKQKFR